MRALPAALVVGALLPNGSLAQQRSGDAVLPAALVGTTWQLAELDGRPPDPDLPPVELRIGPARIEGSAGCNWYTAWLEGHAGAVAVSHLAATGRDCLHPRIMDLEARYLAELERFTAYRWMGDALALMADEKENTWLLFTRQGRPRSS
ncbi:MAG TPA: META domain-containing protein [Gemmatimonadota bacterium]|nr:META domain-containing protein [Gemmatimonadota bacterium]